MTLTKRLLPTAFGLMMLAALPACSGETGDRATTDVSAGSNEAGARTNDSGGEMDAAAADSMSRQTGGTAGQGTQPMTEASGATGAGTTGAGQSSGTGK